MLLDGTKISQMRAARGMSQETLGQLCDLSKRTIQRAENGQPINIESAAFIAEALKVQSADLSAGPQKRRTEDVAFPTATGEVIPLLATRGTRLVEKMMDVFDLRLELEIEPVDQNVDLLEELQEVLSLSLGDPRKEGNASHAQKAMSTLRLQARANTCLSGLAALNISVFVATFQSYQQLDFIEDSNGGLQRPSRMVLDLVKIAYVVVAEAGASFLTRTADDHCEIQDPSLLEGGTSIYSGLRLQDLPAK